MKKQGLVVLLTLFFVYRFWFLSSHTLSNGDWPYLYPENIKEFPWTLDIHFLWLAPYYQILSKVLVQYIGIPWEVVERAFWFWPFIVLSVVSSYYLTKSWIGILIYTTNTYVLMVVGGGQMGVAMAYSVAPLVLAKFIKHINSLAVDSHNFKFQISNFKLPTVTGLILAVEMMFDPRIAYITMIAIIIYALFNLKIFSSLYSIFRIFIIPLAIAFTLNLYWIVPLISGQLPKEYQGLEHIKGFEFLSFGDFSHAFSLLHPNWPENIFGKTYFLNPEFIALPILAFSSLLFISNIKNRKPLRAASFSPRGWNSFTPREILFFGFLGLLGALLAKGTNPPFGSINSFLFQYIPGMSIFRDPSKFYILIALSYSVLIPFSVNSIYSWFNSKFKIQNSKLLASLKLWRSGQFKIQNYELILVALFLAYWLFLIKPAILGQLGGTFKTHQIPQEYVTLKEFLKADPSFGPVLWIPQRQRFGFYSYNHSDFSSPSVTKTFLKEHKIKYVIIPFDSEKELFLKDRKYSESLRRQTEINLDKLPNLTKKKGFGKITVYEVREFAKQY